MNCERRVPILCYHRVHADDDPALPPVIAGEYCGHVTRSRFDRQIRSLVEGGFRVVTHHELDGWLREGQPLPAGPVAAIDFDDNRLNVLQNALPVMREYGVRGTMFVISDLAGGALPGMESYPAMRWEHLLILREAGWALGAHTATHSRLGKLSREADGLRRVEEELTRCNEAMRAHLGLAPTAFAYPTGDFSPEAEAVVKRHYRTARLWREKFGQSFNTCATDPYRLMAINVSMRAQEAQWEAVLEAAASGAD